MLCLAYNLLSDVTNSFLSSGDLFVNRPVPLAFAFGSLVGFALCWLTMHKEPVPVECLFDGKPIVIVQPNTVGQPEKIHHLEPQVIFVGETRRELAPTSDSDPNWFLKFDDGRVKVVAVARE
jgi:hypothetical protein